MTKWLDIAREEQGVTEVDGKASNPKIIEYFESCGSDVKDDNMAWCSAFCNYCMEQAGIKGTMSLAARSWTRWGKETKPKTGAIMVFKRGTSNWQGHVAFYLSETSTHYVCLGGNQGNAVSIKSYPKSAFIGARWPSTMGKSRTAAAMATGGATTVASFVMEQASEAKMLADNLQEYVAWASAAAVVLTIACFGLGIWFRYKDMKEKGR